MTISELYNKGRNILNRAGLESPAFDAMCLLGLEFGICDRTQLAIHGNDPTDEASCERYIKYIERRTHEPLQYILKKWEFDGMQMNVGEGVLIPREDTLTIVECAERQLSGIVSPKILDLCAGSGAIGLSLARRISDAEVICLEKSEAAFEYLEKNIAEFGEGRVKAVRGDVQSLPTLDEKFDCIVSNPPYILSKDVDGLQWEVQCEPRMALDGGADGLNFYRAICHNWLVLLKNGGMLAFESGYDIANGVASVMAECGITHIQRKKDFNGTERCIFGFKFENNT